MEPIFNIQSSIALPADFSLPEELFQEMEMIDKQHEMAALDRKAVRLFASDEESSVRPSDYFYTLTANRPKKFKEIFKNAKDDEDIQKIRQKRRALEQELAHSVFKNLKENIIQTFCFCAEKARPLASLFFCEDDMPAIEKSIKDSYEAIEKCRVPDELFINFAEMSHEDLETMFSRGRDEGYKKKINPLLWEKYKASMHQLIADFWNKEILILGKAQTIRNFFGAMSHDCQNLSSICTSLVELLNVNGSKSDYFMILNPILSIIRDELQFSVENEKKVCLANFAQVFSKEAGTLYVDNLVKTIFAKEKIEGGLSSLKTLRKEQKQHSFARFYNLINYYTAFVNSVQILSNIAEKNDSRLKGVTQKIILQILEHCHIELNNRLEGIDFNSEKAALLEELITIKPNGHRGINVMGREEPGSISSFDKKKLIDVLNILLGTHKNETTIEKLERAHTLPFPACFAWDDDKVIRFISEATGITLQHRKRNQEIAENVQEVIHEKAFFNKDLFKKLGEPGLSHHELESLFSEAFQHYANTVDDSVQFLYLSLGLLRNFYLKLFSETAFLPDFVNRELDGISEWRNTAEDNYKVSLALSLQELIQKDRFCVKRDITLSLKPYLKESVASAVKCHEKLFPDQSEYALLKRISVYQIEESIRLALHVTGCKDIIDEIFSKSVLQDPARSEVYVGKKSAYAPNPNPVQDDEPVHYDPDTLAFF